MEIPNKLNASRKVAFLVDCILDPTVPPTVKLDPPTKRSCR